MAGQRTRMRSPTSSRSSATQAPSVYERIYACVRRIPRGRVATYGQIARLAGIPRGARQVGYAMHRAPAGVPWQRVINARGEVSLRGAEHSGAEHEQRFLLEGEGVSFDLAGRCDLARYAWRPRWRPPWLHSAVGPTRGAS